MLGLANIEAAKRRADRAIGQLAKLVAALHDFRTSAAGRRVVLERIRDGYLALVGRTAHGEAMVRLLAQIEAAALVPERQTPERSDRAARVIADRWHSEFPDHAQPSVGVLVQCVESWGKRGAPKKGHKGIWILAKELGMQTGAWAGSADRLSKVWRDFKRGEPFDDGLMDGTVPLTLGRAEWICAASARANESTRRLQRLIGALASADARHRREALERIDKCFFTIVKRFDGKKKNAAISHLIERIQAIVGTTNVPPKMMIAGDTSLTLDDLLAREAQSKRFAYPRKASIFVHRPECVEAAARHTADDWGREFPEYGALDVDMLVECLNCWGKRGAPRRGTTGFWKVFARLGDRAGLWTNADDTAEKLSESYAAVHLIDPRSWDPKAPDAEERLQRRVFTIYFDAS